MRSRRAEITSARRRAVVGPATHGESARRAIEAGGFPPIESQEHHVNLLITGGQQRRPRPTSAGTNYWYKYKQARIVRVDTERSTVEQAYAYESPPEVTAEDEPAILFKQGWLENGTLYVATQTEVLLFTYPGFERIGYISLPSFNDVHHVRPSGNGTLYVVNTGLDQLLELTYEGDVVNRWNVLGGDPWGERFSSDEDYRKWDTTKPYDAHPNHVFMIDGEVWVTRFKLMDAVSIKDPSRRIDIGVERVHDGLVVGDFVYFTAVSGAIAVADKSSLALVDVIDLNEIDADGKTLGWCRGIAMEGDKAWVGFSRLRPTVMRENIAWVKGGFKRSMPTHIAKYDLVNGTLEDRIVLEDDDLNAVFSIFPA
jgi:hypothetical protein